MIRLKSDTTVDTAQIGTFRRNVKWQLIGSATQLLLGGLLLLITGKQLGAGGFGALSIVLGYVTVANLLLEPRMQDVAAKQFWNINHVTANLNLQRQYFIDLLVVEVLCKLSICIALVLLAPTLAKIGNMESTATLLIVVAALGSFLSKLGAGLSIGVLRVLGRTDLNTLCGTLELVLRLLLTLALIAFGKLTILGYVVAIAISGVISNMALWMMVAKQFEGIDAKVGEWKFADGMRRLLENRRLLFSNLGLSVSDLMNKDLDITLIAPLMSNDQVGVYKMSKNIVLLTWRAVDPFYLALMPEVNRLVETKAIGEVRRLISSSTIGLLGLSIVVSLLSYSLVLLFGDVALGAAYSTVPVLLPWMFLGIITSAPLVWGHPLAVALNRGDVALKGSLFGSIIGLVTFLALTPVYGAQGAGMAWTLTFLLNFVFTATVSYSLLDKRSVK